jgi:glyoxalase family protein
MQRDILGLHHVTAVTASAQANHAFYAGALGLRFVKRTVNFDDPTAYHLYFGDETGAAGTVMTFFAWTDMRRGRVGAGQVSVTQFAAPKGSLDFWADRLPGHGATLLGRETVMGEERLRFADPDGLVFAIVAVDDPRAPWTTPDIGADVALRGFRGVTLSLRDGAGVAAVLRDVFGYARAGEEGGLTRWRLGDAPSGVVDLDVDFSAAPGMEGAGVVHHVAFAVADRAAQARVRERMQAAGLRVTPSIDRDYFWAIYARTPGGVLFEVATEEPGFTADEPREFLGQSLRLPRQHAPRRAEIERLLPPLAV